MNPPSHSVELTGLITCADENELHILKRHLPQHVKLTREEPGCEHFSVEQTQNPSVLKVSEKFTSQAAFEAHQARSQHSEWGRNTAVIARAYAVKDGRAWWALVPHVLGKKPVQAQLGEYAFPGPLRDKLVAAILSGEKTATASVHEEYQRFGEALPTVGELEIVIDSDAKPVCITRNTQVNIVPLSQVTDAHAVAEGEGFKDAAAWRAGHIAFWTSPEFVESMGEPVVEIKDETLVVLVSMEVIAITAAVPGVEGKSECVKLQPDFSDGSTR